MSSEQDRSHREDDDHEHGWGAWVVDPNEQVQQHEGTTFEEEDE